ncbi:MAG: prephenate dehydratase [Planctomycetes bacterium]|nr:prephenate dehydratase [Planctomycetota bacterium]
MDELEKIRGDLNAIDEQILKALAARRDFVGRIIRHKANENLPLRDPAREEEMLTRLIAEGRKIGLDAHIVTRVFHEILDDSVRTQQLYLLGSANEQHHGLKRVAFQGIEGAYSFLAAQKHFARSMDATTFIGYPTFAEAVEAVEEAKVDYAFLPIENTTAGSINEVYDLLAASKLWIIGEEVFRVEHCLLAIDSVPLSSIRRVYSHPQALAQCMKFLSTLASCQLEYFADTAMAARKVKEDQDPTQAAIASEAAARQFGLKILARDLADQKENYTRFLVISPKPIQVDPRIPAKTSLVLAVPHEEGALLKALMVFHEHKINLTKLDGSRPRPGAPFQYLFNVDLEGNIAEGNVRQALDDLRSATSFLKILGTYAVEARGKTTPSMQAIVPPGEAAARADAPDAAPAEPRTSRPAARKLWSREARPEGTSVTLGGIRIGGPEIVVIAGPRAVESRQQVLACARHVKECGGMVLRGGCFRARSGAKGSPLGLAGLELLAEAGRAYDLPVMTEVVAPADVGAVSRLADILEVGARDMQSLGLLAELGRVNRPVLLKRGMSATLEELLEAAERILEQGNQQVVLCERGIRTFETVTRNTLDLAAVPVLKHLTHLPVAVDPSHAAEDKGLLAALALAAQRVGPHALILEIEPDGESPGAAGPKALGFADFARLMRAVYGKR